jgi:hypothetical protein
MTQVAKIGCPKLEARILTGQALSHRGRSGILIKSG